MKNLENSAMLGLKLIGNQGIFKEQGIGGLNPLAQSIY